MINRPWKQLSIQQQALAYATEHGWFVFPSPPDGKKQGLTSAETSNGNRWGCTSNAEEIKAYYKQWPKANVGIATGLNSKIFVLEVDTVSAHQKDGLAALAELEAQNTKLPETLMSQSPSGSVHYFFNYPPGADIRNSESKLAPGIDIRGEGGMVLAPPSIRADGTYKWLNSKPVVDAPQWLIDKLVALTKEHEFIDSISNNDVEASIEELTAAMQVIQHDDDSWGTWNRIGMALWRASNGAAFDLWDQWSQKWAGYNAANTRKRWAAYSKSRPTELGAGTIFYLAQEANADWRAALAPINIDIDMQQFVHATREKLNGQKAPQFSSNAKDAAIKCAINVPMRALQWLWTGHLLHGTLELLTGTPGLGKSQVQISWIASVTAGHLWPDNTAPPEPKNVIMLTAEDTLADTIVPRLVAAHADLNRVYFLNYIRNNGKNRMFLLQEDLVALYKVMESIGNVALITIDPITAFMGGKMDSHKATEVRSQLSPLKNFAEHTGVVISAITHPAKAAGPKAIDHFIGSQAFVAAARIGHVCSEDFETNDDDGRASDWKMFAHAKHNPSKRMPSLRYRIEESFVCNDSQTGVAITAPKVIWDPTPIDMTADEVVRASNPDYAQNKRNDSRVGNWLIDLLTKNGGAMSMIDITSAAFEAGFTKAQIRYAREKCGIVVEKTTGQDSHWVWKLMLDAHSFKKFHL